MNFKECACSNLYISSSSKPQKTTTITKTFFFKSMRQHSGVVIHFTPYQWIMNMCYVSMSYVFLFFFLGILLMLWMQSKIEMHEFYLLFAHKPPSYPRKTIKSTHACFSCANKKLLAYVFLISIYAQSPRIHFTCIAMLFTIFFSLSLSIRFISLGIKTEHSNGNSFYRLIIHVFYL